MARSLPATRPLALTIAGLDPSGGAGIIADIRTFLAFGCAPAAAVTSLTFQSDQVVFGAAHQTAATLRAQVLVIIQDSRVASVKTGMLPSREIVVEVARLLRETDLPSPVVDPVMRSSSGYDLMDPDAVDSLITELMPRARLITPNIPEAEALTGERIESEEGMRRAARKLRQMGARAALIKGGHLREQRAEGKGQRVEVRDQKSEVRGQRGSSPTVREGSYDVRDQRSEVRGQRGSSPTVREGSYDVRDQRSEVRGQRGSSPTVREGSYDSVDVLDDEGRVTVFRGEWIDAPPVRGTGCMLSAAIAACLGKGMTLENSVTEAKRFVEDELRRRSYA